MVRGKIGTEMGTAHLRLYSSALRKAEEFLNTGIDKGRQREGGGRERKIKRDTVVFTNM